MKILFQAPKSISKMKKQQDKPTTSAKKPKSSGKDWKGTGVSHDTLSFHGAL
jgi:hypothetical protein